MYSTEVNGPVAKQQIRDRIRCQIEEFLERGGKIDVLDGCSYNKRGDRASVWHDQQDFDQFID